MNYLEMIGVIIAIISTLGLLTLPVIQYFTNASVEKTKSDNETTIRQAELKNESEVKQFVVKSNNELKRYLSEQKQAEQIAKIQQKNYDRVISHMQTLFSEYVTVTYSELITLIPDKNKQPSTRPLALSDNQRQLEAEVVLYAPGLSNEFESFRDSIVFVYNYSRVFSDFWTIVKGLNKLIGASPISLPDINSKKDKAN
ncbi:hypothetical protein [Furfurilactobacillus rossiae]|uniref:Uncharacterized protein n=1 Tax=Furfurilactobacillus rossiae DSM 15814 TaxID=1114972 RepID=A0A0R1RI72_9LACO|nr:hypothetical protein [Furfurilactobacillus rossiae]KRL56688.1 hypothetical protein FD35_GL001788 [Furfurilactobacillus rossiae DSM 15814]QFR66410.1 hypothetical protein LR814_04585 [Furfurilactobacillus rossiae]QLE61866.1 hypothetical protein LROSRS0_1821 [Furfurilactobacillus rossiae]